MTMADKTYSATLTLVIPGLLDPATVTWPNLKKVEAVAIQNALIGVLATTADWGFQAAAAEGVPAEVIGALKGNPKK
jgi:hypothetical protein